jgi:protein tyrosine phosphatase
VTVCSLFRLCQLNVYLVSDDHSRVRLSVIEGVDGSDYINANFISV